jgi:hypothetical protein
MKRILSIYFIAKFSLGAFIVAVILPPLYQKMRNWHWNFDEILSRFNTILEDVDKEIEKQR